MTLSPLPHLPRTYRNSTSPFHNTKITLLPIVFILCCLLFPHSVTISDVDITATDEGRGIRIGETTALVSEATTNVPTMDLNITWFRAENGSNVQLFQNEDNINITMEAQNTTTRSTLTIRVTGMEDYTQYYCLANNGNSTEMSNGTVTIRRPGETLL